MQVKTVKLDDIIIANRIRKDLGDIEELAQSIKENGLLSPPIVTTDNVLIAGERRIRALRSLEWEEVDVNVVEPKNAAHTLVMEIEENSKRKDFTREEEYIYATRLRAVVQLIAWQRQHPDSEVSLYQVIEATKKLGLNKPEEMAFGTFETGRDSSENKSVLFHETERETDVPNLDDIDDEVKDRFDSDKIKEIIVDITDIFPDFTPGTTARDYVVRKLGISSKTLLNYNHIISNKELLDDDVYESWNNRNTPTADVVRFIDRVLKEQEASKTEGDAPAKTEEGVDKEGETVLFHETVRGTDVPNSDDDNNKENKITGVLYHDTERMDVRNTDNTEPPAPITPEQRATLEDRAKEHFNEHYNDPATYDLKDYDSDKRSEVRKERESLEQEAFGANEYYFDPEDSPETNYLKTSTEEIDKDKMVEDLLEKPIKPFSNNPHYSIYIKGHSYPKLPTDYKDACEKYMYYYDRCKLLEYNIEHLINTAFMQADSKDLIIENVMLRSAIGAIYRDRDSTYSYIKKNCDTLRDSGDIETLATTAANSEETIDAARSLMNSMVFPYIMEHQRSYLTTNTPKALYDYMMVFARLIMEARNEGEDATFMVQQIAYHNPADVMAALAQISYFANRYMEYVIDRDYDDIANPIGEGYDYEKIKMEEGACYQNSRQFIEVEYDLRKKALNDGVEKKEITSKELWDYLMMLKDDVIEEQEKQEAEGIPPADTMFRPTKQNEEYYENTAKKAQEEAQGSQASKREW